VPRVTLYTKPGCHLCDAAARVIAAERVRRTFEFEERNILDDPADYAAYRHEIPVVKVDGVEIARHRLDARQLDAALDACRRAGGGV
jgi:glutaredoxin